MLFICNKNVFLIMSVESVWLLRSPERLFKLCTGLPYNVSWKDYSELQIRSNGPGVELKAESAHSCIAA